MNEEVKKPQENNERHPRNNDAKRPNRKPRRTFDKPKSDLEEKVICINRVTKVVKGGRQFRFAATVVVGNRKGKVGLGIGKAKEMPDAVKKATQAATKNVVDINPMMERIETNPQFAQIISPNDMVALVTMNVKIGDVEGLMNEGREKIRNMEF